MPDGCMVLYGTAGKKYEIREFPGHEPIRQRIKKGKLRWFGPAECKADEHWTRCCTRLEVDGTRWRRQQSKPRSDIL